jgi:hypothetical protein
LYNFQKESEVIFMNRKIIILIMLVITIAFILMGCRSSNNIKTIASEGWTAKTDQEVVNVGLEKYTNSMNDSHYMMAAMILSGQGFDSNLDNYKEVYLVTIETADGESSKMVVADGVCVYPANIGSK